MLSGVRGSGHSNQFPNAILPDGSTHIGGQYSFDGQGGLNTRFITTPEGLITDLQPTINRIISGGKFPHRNDGSIFMNKEGLLPKRASGYYREFVHPTIGAKGAGLQRIVTGQNGQMWFTPDHYKNFIRIR